MDGLGRRVGGELRRGEGEGESCWWRLGHGKSTTVEFVVCLIGEDVCWILFSFSFFSSALMYIPVRFIDD